MNKITNTKKIVLGVIGIFIYNVTICQTTLNSAGMMTVTAQTEDWESGLRVKVPTENSCAFNLWSPYYNGGDDVSFFNATGYLWCRLGGWFGSDSTLKRNVTPIDNPLTKIMQLRGVRFQYKPISKIEQQEYDSLPGHGYRFGLIAQDVEEVIPEVVKTMPNGTKSLTYTDVIAILIEAVKQQQEEIENMKQILIANGLAE